MPSTRCALAFAALAFQPASLQPRPAAQTGAPDPGGGAATEASRTHLVSDHHRVLVELYSSQN